MAPRATQEILDSYARDDFEVFELLRRLIFQRQRRAVINPAAVAKIRLHDVRAATAEFRAFFVGIKNVINELHRNARGAVMVFSKKAAANHSFDLQIRIAADALERALDNLFSFVVR